MAKQSKATYKTGLRQDLTRITIHILDPSPFYYWTSDLNTCMTLYSQV